MQDIGTQANRPEANMSISAAVVPRINWLSNACEPVINWLSTTDFAHLSVYIVFRSFVLPKSLVFDALECKEDGCFLAERSFDVPFCIAPPRPAASPCAALPRSISTHP